MHSLDSSLHAFCTWFHKQPPTVSALVARSRLDGGMLSNSSVQNNHIPQWSKQFSTADHSMDANKIKISATTTQHAVTAQWSVRKQKSHRNHDKRCQEKIFNLQDEYLMIPMDATQQLEK